MFIPGWDDLLDGAQEDHSVFRAWFEKKSAGASDAPEAAPATTTAEPPPAFKM